MSQFYTSLRGWDNLEVKSGLFIEHSSKVNVNGNHHLSMCRLFLTTG